MPRDLDRNVCMRIVPARESHDCCVSALSMFCGASYEDSLRAVCLVDDDGGKDGLHNPQIIEAAAALGVDLKHKRRIDWENDEGILVLRPKSRKGDQHVAVLSGSQVFNTDGVKWKYHDVFLAHYGWEATGIFVEYSGRSA